jgi:hypothetical protein
VYFFSRQNEVQDISRLSPMAEQAAEAEWGGLVGFASRTGQVIAGVVNRAEARPRRKPRAKPAAAEATAE